MKGSRAAIQDKLPYEWDVILRKHHVLSLFCNTLYESMPRQWKNSYHYRSIITRALCWYSVGFLFTVEKAGLILPDTNNYKRSRVFWEKLDLEILMLKQMER